MSRRKLRSRREAMLGRDSVSSGASGEIYRQLATRNNGRRCDTSDDDHLPQGVLRRRDHELVESCRRFSDFHLVPNDLHDVFESSESFSRWEIEGGMLTFE